LLEKLFRLPVSRLKYELGTGTDAQWFPLIEQDDCQKPLDYLK
jgi:hypothetical protein